jgi:hypothetical protein
MKKIIIALAMIGGGFGWLHVLQKRNPEVIAKPVYGEFRVKGDTPGGDIEAVMFVKAVDQQECQEGMRVLGGPLPPELKDGCPTCRIVKAECKPELAPRYARLFDDQPSFVTYVSIARGARTEREYRMIFWGVTAAESAQLCDAFQPELQKKRKGAVKCIHPL